jgi:hypothetical protein
MIPPPRLPLGFKEFPVFFPFLDQFSGMPMTVRADVFVHCAPEHLAERQIGFRAKLPDKFAHTARDGHTEALNIGSSV